MCGIVGYVGLDTAPDGNKFDHNAYDVVLEGLRRQEYRGYDSAGVAVVSPDGIVFRKKAGKLLNLENEVKEHPLPDSQIGIGHTRWATHGGPTDNNAHPHVVDNGRLAVVHNGIIENFAELRAELLAEGVEFASQTDTEVAAATIASIYNKLGTGDLTEAVRVASNRLEGAFTILAIHADHPDRVVATRRNSPLVIGLGENENFLGSDVSAFIDYTKEAVEMGQDQIVTITGSDYSIIDFEGNPAEGKPFHIEWDAAAAEKGGYNSFMEKEIHEQPAAVEQTLMGRLDENGNLTLDELNIDDSVLRSIDKIIVVACGTAAYAGQVARYAIEHWCRIPVEVELSSEFRYRDPVVGEKTLVVAISQSGETMDTIQAIRHAREQGAKVVAIVNTPGSTISRESDAVILTHAGPEIAVASTKAFTAQVAACYILGLYLAQVRGNKYADEIADYMEKLARVPEAIARVLENGETVRQFARTMQDATSVIYLGRHVGFPVALEGALKLKEICYIHAEGFAAGELKHGPIALVDEGQPVIVIVPTPRRPELHGKVLANIAEVRARGARTIVVAEEGDTSVDEFAEVVFRVPPVPTLYAPLLTVVPLQIFACELASVKGLDVDQPRNLAKSVTVE